MLYIITENQRLNFKPTYLYIKQHSITGLKYFGKTTSNPYKYSGSGTHWKRHIKKHGKEHIKTLWCKLYTDIDELVNTAIALSDMFDIVDSNAWANAIGENGLDGWSTSEGNPNKKRLENKTHNFLSDTHPMKIRSINKTHHFLGSTNPVHQQIKNKSGANHIKFCCIFCKNTFSFSNYTNHTVSCKLNPNRRKIEQDHSNRHIIYVCSISDRKVYDIGNFTKKFLKKP